MITTNNWVIEVAQQKDLELKPNAIINLQPYSTDISYEVCKAHMHQTWFDSWHCLNSPLSPCQSCHSCFVEICTPCCNHFKYFTSCHHTPRERSSIKRRTIVPGLAEDDHQRATIFVSFQAVFRHLSQQSWCERMSSASVKARYPNS